MELYATVARVQGASLYFQLKARHPFSAQERITLSLGWLHDREGLFAAMWEDLLEGIYTPYPNLDPYPGFSWSSTSDILWIILSANKMVSSFRLSAVGILNAGTTTLHGSNLSGDWYRYEFPNLGYLLDFQAARNMTDRLSLEVFYLMASGDDAPFRSVREAERLGSFRRRSISAT